MPQLNNTGVPVFDQPIVMPGQAGKIATYWRDFFTRIWAAVSALGSGVGWVEPIGAGATSPALNMNWTTTVSNPPTQAEMTSMRNQVIVLQKQLGQLITDQLEAGTIGGP